MTNEDFLKGIGMELRVARTRKRQTTTELAKVTGLSAACLLDMENGKTDTRILSYKRYADALGVSLKDIL